MDMVLFACDYSSIDTGDTPRCLPPPNLLVHLVDTIVHYRAVFTDKERVPAVHGEVVGVLHSIGAGDVENQQSAVIGGLNALAGEQVLRLDPADILDVPRMVVGDLEDF